MAIYPVPGAPRALPSILHISALGTKSAGISAFRITPWAVPTALASLGGLGGGLGYYLGLWILEVHAVCIV